MGDLPRGSSAVPRPGGLTIALAGGAGSGKSTVARAIADRLGAHVAGFGDFVRHLAAEAGEGTSRADLQRLGQSCVDMNPGEFVHEFLAWAAPPQGPLVIDGVRHHAVDQVLRAWAASNGRDYALVLIDTAIQDRAARRTGGDLAGIHAIDGHPVEREATHDLPGVADAVVVGSGAVGEVLTRIVRELGGKWPAGS